MSTHRVARAETEIDAPIDEVYKAMGEASQTKLWDLDRTVSDIRLGGAVVWNFASTGQGVCRCDIIKVQPQRRLEMEFSWTKVPNWKSSVDIELDPTPRGTRVLVEHRGWPEGPQGDQLFFDFGSGWSGWLEQLKAHVEVARGLVLTKVVEDIRIVTEMADETDVSKLNRILRQRGMNVLEMVRAQRANPIGSVLIYHNRDPWRVEVGSTFEGRLEGDRNLRIHDLKGGLVVARTYIRHPYDYPRFLHGRLAEWCEDNGYRPTGPFREIYTGDIWADKGPVPGEIQVPVSREPRVKGRKR